MHFYKAILFSCVAALVAFTSPACGYENHSVPQPDRTDRLPVGSSNDELTEAVLTGSRTLIQENSLGDFDSDFYLGETVFVGDSRTNGLLQYDLLPPEQVFAIDGSNQKSIQGEKFIQLDQTGIKYTVDQAVAIRRPERILVSFGINAIAIMEEEEFMAEYRNLVDSLRAASPSSTIVIQSILPVAWWKKQELAAFDNSLIDYYNNLLYRYAKNNGYYFMNTAELMKDEKNSLKQEYDAGDGLHFTVSAYNALLQYYRTHPVPNATD